MRKKRKTVRKKRSGCTKVILLMVLIAAVIVCVRGIDAGKSAEQIVQKYADRHNIYMSEYPDEMIQLAWHGIFAAAECFAYAFQADNGLLFHRFLSLFIKKPLPLFSWRGKGESSRYHLAFVSGFAAGSLIKHYHAFARSRAHPLKTTLSPPRLRDHVQLPCRTPFHQTGALLDAHRRLTLPFVAFAV